MNHDPVPVSAAAASTALLDAELVRRALEGERAAFDLLVVRYQRRIAALLARYRLDPGTIEDLTQEAFIKAYRGLAGFRGDSTFFTWLARIALNTAKTYLTENKRRVESVGLEDDAAELDPLASIASGDLTEGTVASRQMGDIINRAMEDMSPELRDALTMREIDGMSYQEIAEALKVPLNTVRSRIFRARDTVAVKLRPLLEVSRSKRW